ncbi:MAG: hypothetical protein ABIF06_00875 [bacterium]
MKKVREKIVLRPETETTWLGLVQIGLLMTLAGLVLGIMSIIMLGGGQVLKAFHIM